jgi:signal transduction histidine kinase
MTADEITLSPVLNLIAETFFQVAVDVLSPDSVNQFMAAYLPIVYYSYEQVARHETLVRIGYYSARLEKVTSELSRLDRSKSHFIAVAAHELKTPLTLIEGYSSMLGEEVRKVSPGGSAEMLLNGIEKGLKRLGEMVNDMIDVSMIDNDMLSLRYQPTWISQILANLENDLQASLNERYQTLEIQPFEGFKEMIIADTERIQQAIRNVMTNAVKYTPNGGKIVVDGRLLSGFLEIRIKDSGIGISPENQVTIFEKFSSLSDARLHSSSKTNFKGGGPGLGLPIARGILEAHGGSIWVESEGYDEERLPGATFHLLLPLRKEPPNEQMSKLFGGTSG